MKVFNCILGVFALMGATYCMLFPGITFLNYGWIITILLGGWGVCAIFEYFTKEDKAKRSGKEAGLGALSLVLGIAVAAMSVWAIIAPNMTSLLMDVVIVYTMAGWMIAGGIVNISDAVKAKKMQIGKLWILTLIWGILFLVTGVIGCFRPLLIAWMVDYLICGLLIIAGVRLIASVFERAE